MKRLWNLTDYIERLSHHSGLVRRWAFKAIEEFHPRQYVQEVSNLIGDPVEHLGCAAPRYIARHNRIEFAPEILECFKNTSGVVAGNCIKALKRMKYEAAYDTVFEKYSHIKDIDEILGVIDYLGIIRTDESREILKSAFEQFKEKYFIGGVTDSLLAHGNPSDIDLIIDQLLKNDKKGMALDNFFRSLVQAVSASDLYRDIAGDYDKIEIFKKTKQVLQDLVQYTPLIADQNENANRIADLIEQGKFENLISTLMFEAKKAVQDRYVDHYPVYLDEISVCDKIAIRILESFVKSPHVVQEIKLKNEKGAKLLSSVIAIYFSVISRDAFISALNPEASLTDLIHSLKKANPNFSESIEKRLIEIAPIADLKNALTKDLNTWGDIWIVKLMGSIGSPSFIPDLIRIINEADSLSFVFGDAIHALQCIDETGHPEMLAAIQDGLISDPLVVMDILGALPYAESFDIACRVWNTEDEEDGIDSYETYAHTLERIGDIRGIEALREILFEGNAVIIGEPLETLCLLYDKELPELTMIHEQKSAKKEKHSKWLESLFQERFDDQAPTGSTYDTDLEQPNGTTFKRITPKVGRNDPCSCGSGKKYKKCCL